MRSRSSRSAVLLGILSLAACGRATHEGGRQESGASDALPSQDAAAGTRDAAETHDAAGKHNPAGTRDASPEAQAAESAPATGLRFLGVGGDDATGFARALVPRAFEFPADYGSHPAFRTEWWYYTGNVFDSEGRHYGFELTFFRYALAPRPPESASRWATNQVWMAHFAVTDTQGGRLLAEQRLSRGALDLAGARASPFRVWVEDWSAAAEDHGFSLHARGEQASLDLHLDAVTPPVPNGDRGLDSKGPEPGNASYYYSVPKLAVSGTISTGDKPDTVHGFAWIDREWSTSALSKGDAGWDWFALQLTDGRELMFYRLRRKNGDPSPFSGGSLIEDGGHRIPLTESDVRLEPLEYWTSKETGARYPVAWRLSIPQQALSLTVRPYLRDQEIDLTVRYWEGAVKVEGSTNGRPIGGNGYLELTGYGP